MDATIWLTRMRIAPLCRMAALALLVVLCSVRSAAWAETMSVSTQQLQCSGSLTVASETGTTPFTMWSDTYFTVNVTPLSRIVSAGIVWNRGNNGSMCLVYCQLYVNGVKHTDGTLTIRNWLTQGPQYSFRNLNGSRTGSQSLVCVRDNSMQHLPQTYGDFPLP